ncbi:hypothetical protein JOQ06_023483 [Pogonophryne albipinna]|uniref:DDE Tnp4 domain-containing protein n=1 Tax=Pogonophryne albipinna TaxID=1090488 RepID=A0AAD6BJ88_9TELE|nr:hypothetical protein JOQ06_023483 [Pogonophryne albipinna]
MSAEQMDELLSLLCPELTRQSTNDRAAIEPKQRLAVALRYLASGDSLISLAFNYRLECTTVTNSVHMVYAAIEKMKMERFLPRPTEETWKEVAQCFWRKSNFPNCLRAIDGKHIVIQALPLSGSQYFNYKKTFSIVLMALVDADYSTSPPGAAHLGEMPFVIVGDAAFPLKPYLMRPYPGKNLTHQKRIFNYRLSRARMVVENAFGILASRWRIFHRRINLHPKNVDTLVVAGCILHNFLLAPSENQRLLDEEEQQGRHMAPDRMV